MAATATVTFLFVDLVGSTELLHRIGDDANDDLTRRYQSLMREVVTRHRGTVLRTAGDGLTVVFEHSVADAVSAAIDMQRVIDRMGRADPLLRLQIRVGLSVGEASQLAGDWSGTPIFEAARLESKARPGTILVNDVIRVLLGTRGGFEFTPIGALELKGFPHPLPAAEVAWEPDPGRPQVPLPSALEVGLDWPLLGRADEHDTLRRGWGRVATDGRAAAVIVAGEAGMGKTRLVAELALDVQQGRTVASGTVLYGRADDSVELPLGALADALRWWVASVPPEVLRTVVGSRAGALAAMIPSLSARLPELMGGSASVDEPELVDAVVEVVGRIAHTGPVLLVVDAADVATPATIEALRRVATLDQPVLVVLAGRDPTLVDAFAETPAVVLAGLDREAVAALLDVAAGRAGVDELPDDLPATALEETGGNPRLVVEAGERVVASGVLGLTAGAERDAAVRKALSGASPYRGLLAYQAEHAEDFFGRDDDVAGLLARLAAARVLAVVGASGSGKSSLVRAGVVPALRRGALAGSRAWPVVLFNAGPHPLLELAAGVAQAVDRPVGEVVAAFEEEPDGLDRVLAAAPAAEDRGTATPGRVVVVVDQLEELFTLCRDAAERERFVDTLLQAAAVPGGRALVVLVLRSDFYGHCADLPGLAAALETATVLLGPMDEAALRSVIEGPARRADLEIEPGLTDVLVRDVVGEPGGLALLSHALYETWRRRENRTLTLAGYRGAGGAQGAIANTAEAIYTDRLDDEQRRVARRVFLAVTELGEGTEDTRRRARRSELVDPGDASTTLDEVIEILVGARLLTVGDGTVEVAHEAVIREWPRLRTWLDEDRETLREVRRLATAAAEWERGGRHDDDLYRGPRLAAAREAAAASALSGIELEFVEASRAVEEDRAREQERQNRRLRRLLVGVGVLLVVALLAGLVAAQQRSTAEDRAADADFERLLSQSVDVADSNPSLAFLLALEAHGERDTSASRATLFTTLQRQQDFLGYTPTEGVSTGATLVGPDTLVYGTRDATVGFLDLTDGSTAGEPLPFGARPDQVVHTFVADDPSRSPDDPVVVARADTGQVWSVDVADHRFVGEPIDNGQAVFAVAASARLGLVASARADGTVAVDDLASGERVALLPAPRGGAGSGADEGSDPGANESAVVGAGGAGIDIDDAVALAFSPVGEELAVARSDAGVVVWDPRTGEPGVSSAADEAYYVRSYGALAYRPDGGQVVVFTPATYENLRAVDTRSGAVDWRRASLSGAVQATYTADGESVLTADAAGDVADRDPATGDVRSVLVESGIGSVQSLDLSPAGDRVVLASGADELVAAWALTGGGPLITTFGATGQYPQQIDPDGRSVLVTGGDDYAYSLWDPATGDELEGDLPMAYGGYGDPGNLFGLFEDDGGATGGQYDLAEGARVPPPIELVASQPSGAYFNRATGLLVVAYEDGSVHFYARDGTEPHPPLTVDGSASVEAFSADGRSVLVGASGGDALLFDVDEGQSSGRPVPGVTAAAFTDDDRVLLLGLADGALQAVDATTLDPLGDPLLRLPAPADDISPTADGALVSVVSGNRFRLLDRAAGRQIGDNLLLGDPSDVVYGTVAPNGAFFVVSGEDGVESWDLRPDRWRADACRLAGRNLTADEWDTYLGSFGSYHATCPQWPAG